MRNLLFLASLVLFASACGSSEKEEAKQYCKAVAAARDARDAASVEAVGGLLATLKPTSSSVQRGHRSLTEWVELSQKAAELTARLGKVTDEERAPLENELGKIAPRLQSLETEFLGEVQTLVSKTGVDECKNIK